MTLPYTWHEKPCKIVTKAPFRKGIKRNALIEFEDGSRMVIPWRAIRKVKGE